MVSKTNGTQHEYHVYYPYGEEINGPPQGTDIRLKYTAHERDLRGTTGSDPDDDDIDYMHARFSSPKVARFLSADPINSGDPKKPQSWNKYAYVEGNPIVSFDPDGLEDRRTVAEVEILESPQVLAAYGAVHLWTGLDGQASDRQEVGFSVGRRPNGSFVVDPGVLTQGSPDQLRLPARMGQNGPVTFNLLLPLAAQVHSHPGPGPEANGASLADANATRSLGVPNFIMNRDESMIAVSLNSSASGHSNVSVRTILDGQDYERYRTRAVLAAVVAFTRSGALGVP